MLTTRRLEARDDLLAELAREPFDIGRCGDESNLAYAFGFQSAQTQDQILRRCGHCRVSDELRGDEALLVRLHIQAMPVVQIHIVGWVVLESAVGVLLVGGEGRSN